MPKKKTIKKISTLEMEVALLNFLDFRKKLIVTNVSWGMHLLSYPLHECDILMCSKAGYLTEVEIKISLADLKADKKKKHSHNHPAIKYFYYAIPDYLLESSIDHIPNNAGIILVKRSSHSPDYFHCKISRKVKAKTGYKLTDRERLKLASLGSMRIYTLKKQILKFKTSIDILNNIPKEI